MSELDSLLTRLRCATTPSETARSLQAIIELKTEAAIPLLIDALAHHHPAVAAAAVSSLITAYQATQDQAVQAQIIRILAQIGDPKAVNLLAEVVGVAVANHCQGNVRRVAARGLGRIASVASNAQIVGCVVDKLTWALKNPEDWALRYAAVVSLQEIASDSAVSILQEALTQEQDRVVQTRIKIALTQLNATAIFQEITQHEGMK
ncbi:HEAT repeat domain-containing protein [Chroococcidiopsis sp. TS-821]|uniref:HEAT repeat domain-containing protein n=1 Tax=Chroococcidiopsis sp. TS-821 TaxID=1378066 RepID=UPI000CEF4672|nr:HEAT repeat domain-containing protein [Chroococcidiopsis sp. TS-821]PPS43217.1 glycosyl transferase family 2 [Chroococcidiopsis sp. TS-821]